MKADHIEYKDIIKKLLEKTRQGRVEWTTEVGRNSFRSTIGAPETRNALAARAGIARPNEEEKNFSFTVTTSRADDSCPTLIMWDHSNNEIFRVMSNDLPTSPEEEEVSQMIDEIYELARRQALKIEQKLEWASTLLDRV
ncbi:MAG TPA: hypothetical protein VJX30_05395 [Terriglobales bacterium]|jgi:hypothetical protein|nr:hypothetical protein [Terriglobales bacterium]